jgi:hypothetical protein
LCSLKSFASRTLNLQDFRRETHQQPQLLMEIQLLKLSKEMTDEILRATERVVSLELRLNRVR